MHQIERQEQGQALKDKLFLPSRITDSRQEKRHGKQRLEQETKVLVISSSNSIADDSDHLRVGSDDNPR
jgi:hypothetical protein